MTTKETLSIKGMDCAECALTLERGVANMPGVHQAHVNFTLAQMTLDYDAQEVGREAIVKRVRELGYDVDETTLEADGASGWRSLWSTIRRRRQEVLAALGAVLIGLAFGLHLTGAPDVVSHALYAVATVASGHTSARAAWAALRTARSPDMNVLMTLAAIGALAIGEFKEGAIVTFLFALGNLLERYTMDRARNAIRALMDLTPLQATRLTDGGEEQVGVEVLAVGDRTLVRPGERIPMDGQSTKPLSPEKACRWRKRPATRFSPGRSMATACSRSR
jgi:Cd2+/Zn2+-exporting ATPase